LKPTTLSSLAGIVIAGALVTTLGLTTGCKDNAAKDATPAATSTAAEPAPAPLSPEDIKEMAARDKIAAEVAEALHAKVPIFKNVKIYADNYVGDKAPSKTPQMDPKTRKGDNLNLVFVSNEAGTANALSDFSKTPAAKQAADAGFNEFQFVDPSSFCYTIVDSTTGPGPVKCGIR
jgi:hypothetical protein